MKLTENENQTLYRMKRKESAWCLWGKWALLILGAVEIYYFLKILSYVTDNRPNPFYPDPFRPLLVQVAIFALIVGIACSVAAVQNWNGTVRGIIIKLIETATKEKEKDPGQS